MSYVKNFSEKLAEPYSFGSKKLSLDCEIHVEIDEIQLKLKGKDKNLVVSFGSLTDFMHFIQLRREKRVYINKLIKKSETFLDSFGVTLCLFSRSMAILGPRAGFLLPRLLGVRI